MQSKHECLKTEKGEKFTVDYRKDAKGHIYRKEETVSGKRRREGGWDQGEAHGGFKTAITSYF